MACLGVNGLLPSLQLEQGSHRNISISLITRSTIVFPVSKLCNGLVTPVDSVLLVKRCFRPTISKRAQHSERGVPVVGW